MRFFFALFLTLPLAWAQLTISGPATCLENTTCTYSASGGTPPYTFTMVLNSVGSITTGGSYTAPASVTMTQQNNGCPVGLNNSIFNTAISALPVHASNAVWFSNIDSNNVGYGGGEQSYQTVLSTSPTTSMTFFYTGPSPGNFIFPPTAQMYSEFGMGTAIQQTPGEDNHVLVTYKDNCEQQEQYQTYPAGFSLTCPSCNAQSGTQYSLTSFNFPTQGTDAAGLPFVPLMIHQSEIQAAIAGNVNAIQHAVRLTLDTASINRASNIWPAQANNGTNGCQGNGFAVNTSGTAVTATGGTFRTGWPANMTVTINGSNYTIASVTDSTHLTLNTSAGTQTGVTFVQPNTNCPPYGARFRMKSSVTAPTCTQTFSCQAIVNAIIQAAKTYGYFLADIGTSWELDVDGRGATTCDDDLCWALLEIRANITGDSTHYEIVDESTLQTNQTYTGTSATWLEAKLGNAYVTPSNSAVVKVTDNASSVAFYSVAIQGVTVGVANQTEVVQAGAQAIQFSPWVNGSANTGYTCAISPTGANYGSITSGCFYTPPTSVAGRFDTTVTVTSAADANAKATFDIAILPSTNGSLFINLGKVQTTNYIDTLSNTWWTDELTNSGAAASPILFPYNNGMNYSGFNSGPYTGTITATAPNVFNHSFLGGPDQHFNIWTTAGTHAVTVYLANPAATATGQMAFSMDCNGSTVVSITDYYTATAAQYGTYGATCNASGPYVQVVVRTQSIATTASASNSIVVPCCTANAYYLNPSPGGNPGAIEIAGIQVQNSVAPPAGGIGGPGISRTGIKR